MHGLVLMLPMVDATQQPLFPADQALGLSLNSMQLTPPVFSVSYTSSTTTHSYFQALAESSWHFSRLVLMEGFSKETRSDVINWWQAPLNFKYLQLNITEVFCRITYRVLLDYRVELRARTTIHETTRRLKASPGYVFFSMQDPIRILRLRMCTCMFESSHNLLSR